MVAGCAAPAATPSDTSRLRSLAQLTHGFSHRSLVRVTDRMDPAMLALARRHDPIGAAADVWGRPEGWATLNMAAAPTLGVTPQEGDQARRLNAMLPVSEVLPAAAPPFILRATGPERERAVLCLTQAIYYEAALEPHEGQEAVAQTVLNRMRHPEYPHTVCGVVYQGSQRVTGCQFSFTCDGSRSRAPVASIWQQTREVAERALSGYVQPRIGTSTFYHADYVFPSWGPTLVKIGQIGRHIFYRFPGPIGTPPAFTRRWSGGELQVSMAGPPMAEVLAQQAARAAGSAAGDAGVTILQITDPTSPTGLRTRVAGQVLFGRRAPTREEIARINQRLTDLERTDPGLATPASDLPMATAGADAPHDVAPTLSAPANAAPTPRRGRSGAGRTQAGSPPVGAAPAPLATVQRP